MSTILSGVVPGLLLVALLGSPAWAQTRIATVDMTKLFDGYYRTKQARAALDERKAGIEKEHANMLEDLQKLKEQYRTTLAGANDQAVSPGERDTRRKLSEDKLKELKKSEDNLLITNAPPSRLTMTKKAVSWRRSSRKSAPSCRPKPGLTATP